MMGSTPNFTVTRSPCLNSKVSYYLTAAFLTHDELRGYYMIFPCRIELLHAILVNNLPAENNNNLQIVPAILF